MSLQKTGTPRKVKGESNDYENAESTILSWGLRHGGQVSAYGGYEEGRGQPRTMAKTDDIHVELYGNPDQTAHYSVEIPADPNGNREAVEELLESLDTEEKIPL